MRDKIPLSEFAECEGELWQIIKQTYGGMFMREYWPFGRHEHYLLPCEMTGLVYGEYFYISPRGTLHPEVIADLRENWRPLGLDDSNWFRNNL